MSFLAGNLIDFLCDLNSKPVIPEFDGPAGMAAIALLVSVAAVVYDKSKK